MIKPIGDKVLLKIDVQREEKIGRVFIPEDARKLSMMAEVIEFGDEVEGLEIGDKVFYKKLTGTDIEIKREQYLIIDREDIIARYKE